MVRCGTQTYWYESGIQRARFCGDVAVCATVALDGYTGYACAEHGNDAFNAGATLRGLSVEEQDE